MKLRTIRKSPHQGSASTCLSHLVSLETGLNENLVARIFKSAGKRREAAWEVARRLLEAHEMRRRLPDRAVLGRS
ncbi:MAG: hypothetical protein ACYDC1_23560 [Limisphaerales bacterium]